MTRKIALVDLDGTLADYDGAMAKGLISLSAGVEFPTPLQGVGFTREQNPPWLQERERMVRSMPGFYRNLAEIPMGMYMFRNLLQEHFECHIATKCPSHNSAVAAMEKIQWCEGHLGYEPKVTICGDKSLLFGDLLFDDWPGYTTPWLDRHQDGIVLMLDQPWNATYEHERVIRVKNQKLERSMDYLGAMDELTRIQNELMAFGLIKVKTSA